MSLLQAIENSRQDLVLQADISKKTVVGCPEISAAPPSKKRLSAQEALGFFFLALARLERFSRLLQGNEY